MTCSSVAATTSETMVDRDVTVHSAEGVCVCRSLSLCKRRWALSSIGRALSHRTCMDQICCRNWSIWAKSGVRQKGTLTAFQHERVAHGEMDASIPSARMSNEDGGSPCVRVSPAWSSQTGLATVDNVEREPLRRTVLRRADVRNVGDDWLERHPQWSHQRTRIWHRAVDGSERCWVRQA